MLQVKVAWFMAILVLIDKAPSFLEDSHKKLCQSIFTNLDCDDCNLLPLVWEIALHCCDIIPVRIFDLLFSSELLKCQLISFLVCSHFRIYGNT